jgi:hypothetical protein
LKGHGFSRAANAAKSLRALAPEEMSHFENDLFRGSIKRGQFGVMMAALSKAISLASQSLAENCVEIRA